MNEQNTPVQPGAPYPANTCDQPSNIASPNPEAKNRVNYVILALLLGGLGVHNFYAGYTGKGVAQLCITVLSLGTLSFISALWALIEIFTVMKDARGVPFS